MEILIVFKIYRKQISFLCVINGGCGTDITSAQQSKRAIKIEKKKSELWRNEGRKQKLRNEKWKTKKKIYFRVSKFRYFSILNSAG